MITEKDRAYYIGASDVGYVVGNWETKSFRQWYWVKLGISTMNFVSEAMLVGTMYEHPILDSLGIANLEKDKQVIQGRLRVNLDGNTSDTIYEVKTYQYRKKFCVSKQYQQQIWVQMYATGIRKAYLVAYGVTEQEYHNFYCEIVPERVRLYPISYNQVFIETIFLPRFQYITSCFEQETFPTQKKWEQFLTNKTIASPALSHSKQLA